MSAWYVITVGAEPTLNWLVLLTPGGSQFSLGVSLAKEAASQQSPPLLVLQSHDQVVPVFEAFLWKLSAMASPIGVESSSLSPTLLGRSTRLLHTSSSLRSRCGQHVYSHSFSWGTGSPSQWCGKKQVLSSSPAEVWGSIHPIFLQELCASLCSHWPTYVLNIASSTNSILFLKLFLMIVEDWNIPACVTGRSFKTTSHITQPYSKSGRHYPGVSWVDNRVALRKPTTCQLIVILFKAR